MRGRQLTPGHSTELTAAIQGPEHLSGPGQALHRHCLQVCCLSPNTRRMSGSTERCVHQLNALTFSTSYLRKCYFSDCHYSKDKVRELKLQRDEESYFMTSGHRTGKALLAHAAPSHQTPSLEDTASSSSFASSMDTLSTRTQVCAYIRCIRVHRQSG